MTDETRDWTAPAITRRPEPSVGGERAMLEDYLEFQRETLLVKCAGLSAAQLRTRSAPPSTMSLLGIVRHIAAVERWWFRMNLAGEKVEHLFFDETNWDGDFDDVDTADARADFETYAEELTVVRAVAARYDLDDTFYNDRRAGDRSLRWLYLHLIEEYARHNGHADLLRERIDGATGE